MIKPKRTVDIIYLVVLLLLLFNSEYLHFTIGRVITINTYAGFLLVLVASYLRFTKSEKFQAAVLLILATGCIGLLNYSDGVYGAQIVTLVDGWYYNTIGFNPVAFIFLIIYVCINLPFFEEVYYRLFSNNEHPEKWENFYYNKFKNTNAEEFEKIKSLTDSYPLAAQTAIRKITDERAIDLSKIE